jgi:hypothetical protein
VSLTIDAVITLKISQRFKIDPALATDGDSEQTVTQISSRQCLKGAGAGASDFSVDDSGSNRATVQHRGLLVSGHQLFWSETYVETGTSYRGPKRLTKPKRKSNFDKYVTEVISSQAHHESSFLNQ